MVKLFIDNNDIKVATKNTINLNEQLSQTFKVELPEGKIYINDTILMKRGGNYLTGKGAATELIMIGENSRDIIKVTNDRCVISDLMIIGNKNNIINQDKFHEDIGHGILIDTSYRTLIQNVYIHDTPLDGIYSKGSSYDKKSSLTTINNCVIERAGRHSIHHHKFSQDPIIFNTFTQDADSDGLFLDNNYGSVITNSHFYRNNGNNVYVIGGGRHRFENCTIDRSQKWGMHITKCNDIIISKCILFDNNQSKNDHGAIFLEYKVYNSIIMQNTIYNDPPVVQDYGIKIGDSCMKNNVVFNEIRNSIKSDYIIDNQSNLVLYGKDNELYKMFS
jgi:hypothetical protein